MLFLQPKFVTAAASPLTALFKRLLKPFCSTASALLVSYGWSSIQNRNWGKVGPAGFLGAQGILARLSQTREAARLSDDTDPWDPQSALVIHCLVPSFGNCHRCTVLPSGVFSDQNHCLFLISMSYLVLKVMYM